MPKVKLSLLGQYLAHSQGSVCSASLGNAQPTHQLLATGGEDNKAHIWTIGKTNCILSLTAHKKPVHAVTFNKDGDKLATGSRSGSVKIWDLQSIKEVRELSGHKSAVTNLDFLPFGDFIASSSEDCLVKVWDTRRRGCVRSFIGHNGPVNTLRVTPDGKWIVSGGDDGAVRVWDIALGKELHSFKIHTGPVISAYCHPSVLLVMTTSVDGTYKIFDLDDFKTVASSPRKSNESVAWAIFHPDEPIVYSATSSELQVSSYESSSEVLESVSIEQWKGISHFDAGFSKDSNVLVTVGNKPNTGLIYTFALNTKTCAPFVLEQMLQSVERRGFGQPNKDRKPLFDENAADEPTNEVPTDPRQQEIHDVDEYRRLFQLQRPDRGDPRASPAPEPDSNAIVNNFLPQREEASADMSDIQVLRTLRRVHDSFVRTIDARHKNLQNMRVKWASSGEGQAMEEACRCGDQAVIVDLLNILLENQRLWSLDLACTVLPSLTTLIQSKHISHVETACQAVRLILKRFTGVIKDNISCPPGGGGNNRAVDLNREERYQKCLSCYRNLKAANSALKQSSIATRTVIEGAREVAVMMEALG